MKKDVDKKSYKTVHSMTDSKCNASDSFVKRPSDIKILVAKCWRVLKLRKMFK